MPILRLRQHLAVIVQFAPDWGAADLVRATHAPSGSGPDGSSVGGLDCVTVET
jgi:hypothetical protein